MSVGASDKGEFVDNAGRMQLGAGGGNSRIVAGQAEVQERPDMIGFVQIPESRLRHSRELACLGAMTGAVRDSRSLADTFRQTAGMLPEGWPDPEGTFARIVFDGRVYMARAFVPVGSRLSSDIVVGGAARGELEVYCPRRCKVCIKGRPASHHRALIDVAAHLLGQAAENHIYRQSERVVSKGRQRLGGHASELSWAEERARQQLLSALHDEVDQNLAAAQLQLSMLVDSDTSQEHAEAVADVGKLIEEATNDISSLRFDLCPPVLYEEGLAPALAWQVDRFRRKYALSLEFVDEGLADELSSRLRADVFHIVRELLTNVVRHARSSSAMVIAAASRGRLEITVTDDGIGFDPEIIRRPDDGLVGFGLRGIRRRLEHLGGWFEIRSAPGHGSRVTVTVPSGRVNEFGER